MNFDKYLYKIVFGIRHKRTFAQMNASGHILDAIGSLNGKGYFPKQCFTKVHLGKGTSSFRIADEDETLIIDATLDGLVFTCDMFAEPRIEVAQLKQMFEEILDQYFKYSPGKQYINRIGILNFYKFDHIDNSAKVLLNSLAKYDVSEGIPDQFLYRFSVKHPTSATLIPNDLYDYRNTIFTINAERSPSEIPKPPDLIELNVDHQIYFHPERGYSQSLVGEHYQHYTEYFKSLFAKEYMVAISESIEKQIESTPK